MNLMKQKGVYQIILQSAWEHGQCQTRKSDLTKLHNYKPFRDNRIKCQLHDKLYWDKKHQDMDFSTNIQEWMPIYKSWNSY